MIEVIAFIIAIAIIVGFTWRKIHKVVHLSIAKDRRP